jgi:hypothetical protein
LFYTLSGLRHSPCRNDCLGAKQELSGWAIAIDYLNKIVMGYQFIAAFRKYGKN